MSEASKIIEAAKKIFGLTKECDRAGFILPDGTLLDLGDPAEGGPGKAFEHWSILSALTSSIWSSEQRYKLDTILGAFMEITGAMRTGWGPSGGYVEMFRPATPEQAKAIGDCACDEAEGVGAVDNIYMERYTQPGGRAIAPYMAVEVLNTDVKHCGTIRQEVAKGLDELAKEEK